MNYILVSTILMLIITLVHSCFRFYNQKKTSENQIKVLKRIITKLQEKQLAQQKKLLLSDALHHHLKDANKILRSSVVDLNKDLIENLFNKKS